MIAPYLAFRKQTTEFHDRHFSTLCTQKCFSSQLSACCQREGIITFFADLFINAFQSSADQLDRIINTLVSGNPTQKCVYLGQSGCLWRIKPIVCEMFLCDHAKQSVLDTNPSANAEWERLQNEKKRFTWPDRQVLFDTIEHLFLDRRLFSTLMYLNTSPGLLQLKKKSGVPVYPIKIRKNLQ